MKTKRRNALKLLIDELESIADLAELFATIKDSNAAAHQMWLARYRYQLRRGWRLRAKKEMC